MRRTRAGVASVGGAIVLAIFGLYALGWGSFYLAAGIDGQAGSTYRPFQFGAIGVTLLGIWIVAWLGSAFFLVRSWHYFRGKVAIRFQAPALDDDDIKRELTGTSFPIVVAVVAAITATLLYFVAWGLPDFTNFVRWLFLAGLVYLSVIPSIFIRAFLHSIALWIVGRVPNNEIHFTRQMNSRWIWIASTDHDTRVWSTLVSFILTPMILGLGPIVLGPLIQQPIFVVYGLVMLLFVASGDVYMSRLIASFPLRASFNDCAAHDPLLGELGRKSLANPVSGTARPEPHV